MAKLRVFFPAWRLIISLGFSAWGEYVMVVLDLSFQTQILLYLSKWHNSSCLNCPRPIFLRS